VKFVDKETENHRKNQQEVDFSSERMDEAFGATGRLTTRIVTNSGENFTTGLFTEQA